MEKEGESAELWGAEAILMIVERNCIRDEEGVSCCWAKGPAPSSADSARACFTSQQPGRGRVNQLCSETAPCLCTYALNK